MTEKVEVKKCCWVCEYFMQDLDNNKEWCYLGHNMKQPPYEYVCADFVLWDLLKPEEGEE